VPPRTDLYRFARETVLRHAQTGRQNFAIQAGLLPDHPARLVLPDLDRAAHILCRQFLVAKTTQDSTIIVVFLYRNSQRRLPIPSCSFATCVPSHSDPFPRFTKHPSIVTLIKCMVSYDGDAHAGAPITNRPTIPSDTQPEPDVEFCLDQTSCSQRSF
jgi:hypothetical protein